MNPPGVYLGIVEVWGLTDRSDSQQEQSAGGVTAERFGYSMVQLEHKRVPVVIQGSRTTAFSGF